MIFEYGLVEQRVEKTRDDIIKVLSMGEKRALYLLNVLFDLESVKKKAEREREHYLVIIDDIADSFDYKNKYAIIEYINELTQEEYIDTLILTHNFDFYRTVCTRINIPRNNSFIIQKDNNNKLIMSSFQYRKDIFKREVVDGIGNGQINTSKKKKWLIAGIPFIRNLAEYEKRTDIYNRLTQILHIKEDTYIISILEIWNYYIEIIQAEELRMENRTIPAINLLKILAKEIYEMQVESIALEDKIILSMAIRLMAEEFMISKFHELNIIVPNSSSNQTREWSNELMPYFTPEESYLLGQVNLITPENIHINAFMYEPIIDISDWQLKDLYRNIKDLHPDDVADISIETTVNQA